MPLTTIAKFHKIQVFDNLLLWNKHGLVILRTGFGTFSYSWTHRGPLAIAAFLAKLSPEYLAKKLLGHNAYQIDHDATVAAIKHEILSLRSADCLTRESAREEWNILKGYDPLFNQDFRWWMDETSLDDPGEYSRTKLSEDFEQFWTSIWLPEMQPELNRIAGAAAEAASF
jgi:hypothetical protein